MADDDIEWLSDFDTTAWATDARDAAEALGWLLDVDDEPLTVIVQRPDADGWKSTVWLNGPCRGYFKYDESTMALYFGSGVAILDFAQFDALTVSDEDGTPTNHIATLDFTGMRVIIELRE